MDPVKQSYDMLGEKAWEKLDAIYTRPRSASRRISIGDEANPVLNSHGACEKPADIKRDLYALLQQNFINDDVLGQLWAEVNTVPSWVSWDQIARGQDCFYRYGGPVLTGLAFQSLLGGMEKS